MAGSMGRNASVQRLSTCQIQKGASMDRENAYTKTRSEIVPEEGISRYSEQQHDTALA
jgi:hypothetical protein